MNATIRHIAALPLLAAAALLAACTGDDPLVINNGGDDPASGQIGEWKTRFVTGKGASTATLAAPAVPDSLAAPEQLPLTEAMAEFRTFTSKTYLNSDGTFWWTTGEHWVTGGTANSNWVDNIFVLLEEDNYDPSVIVAPIGHTIDRKKDLAEFFFEDKMEEEQYQVLYTGKPGVAAGIPADGDFRVTIADRQHQDIPNDSQHLEDEGDCGSAWATKQSNGDYLFTLEHQAVYLLFTPYTHRAPQMDRCKLIRIEVEDISSTANYLAGNFGFQFGDYGLDATPRTGTGSRKVTLTLGSDKKGWDLDEKVDTLLAQNGRDTAQDGQYPKDGAYMVIAPGSTDLRITYYVQYFTLQSPYYENFGDDTTEGIWRYQYDWNWKRQAPKTWYIKDTGCLPAKKDYSQYEWVLPDANSEYIGTMEGFGDETGFYTFTRELHFDEGLQPNDFKRIAHRLPIIEADSIYDFCQSYYQWDAAEPFWEGWDWSSTMLGVGASGTNDSYPKSNDDAILTKLDNVVGTGAYQNTGGDSRKVGFDYLYMRNMPEGTRSTADMPTANQMSWIIDYAKPHYDPDTKWYMKEFNDGYTLCRGGVWLLKTEKMVDHEGNLITSNADYIAGKTSPRYDKTLLRNMGSFDKPYITPANNRLTAADDAQFITSSLDHLTSLYGGSYKHSAIENNGETVYPDELEYQASDGTWHGYSTVLDLNDGSPNDNLRRYYKRDYLNPSKSQVGKLRDQNLTDEWGYDATKRPRAEEMRDYYFIPFFGYYESLDPTEVDVKPWENGHVWTKLKLVGVRTHLWSKTPWRRRHFWAKHNTAGTSSATPKLPKWLNNNSFYFYANEEYVAVSWYGLDESNQNRWGQLAGRRHDGTKWFK